MRYVSYDLQEMRNHCKNAIMKLLNMSAAPVKSDIGGSLNLGLYDELKTMVDLLEDIDHAIVKCSVEYPICTEKPIEKPRNNNVFEEINF